MATYVESAARGAVAGVMDSIVQTCVGLAFDKLLLPPKQHDRTIRPRRRRNIAVWGKSTDAQTPNDPADGVRVSPMMAHC